MQIKKCNHKEKSLATAHLFNLQAQFFLWLFPIEDHFRELQPNASDALLCESLWCDDCNFFFCESFKHTTKCIQNEVKKSQMHTDAHAYVNYKAFSHFFYNELAYKKTQCLYTHYVFPLLPSQLANTSICMH